MLPRIWYYLRLWYMIYWYLRLALLFGFHRHVYRCADNWVLYAYTCRGRAAWEIQNALIGKGYHCCPFCFLVTEEKDEHMGKKSCPAYERQVQEQEQQEQYQVDWETYLREEKEKERAETEAYFRSEAERCW